jgi:hypothetical protein
VRTRFLLRSRLRLNPGVGRGGDHLPEAEAGAEPWGRARRRPPSEAEAQGRARRSFLLRLRLNLAVVSLTLAGGTAVGAGQATLFSCQVGQWRGEVTTVTSALPTEERVSG